MLLLDTHIWLWWVDSIGGKLSESALEQIETAETVAVSAISCFEIEWLVRHGRVKMGVPLDEWFALALAEANVMCLPITGEIARLAAALPEHHKDPQDRIIIATAILHKSNIISSDSYFREYAELEDLLVKV
jgi:PIN domain nuclease of toxin-antitoxin system